MERLEDLMDEYNNLKFVFQPMMPKGLSGFIIKDTVYINSSNTCRRMYATIAEELGHWETSSQKNITDYRKNGKEELQAREWSYKKIIPIEELERFRNEEVIADYEMSDELDLPIDVVRGAYDMYKRKGDL